MTKAEFQKFVDETSYVSDSHRWKWSIKMITVYTYQIDSSLNWETDSYKGLASHISYSDAMAYCKWSNTRLPSKKEYWKYARFYPQIVGSLWDWGSDTDDKGNHILLGGSYLCDITTCNGTDKNNAPKFRPADTAANNIGFCVLKPRFNLKL